MEFTLKQRRSLGVCHKQLVYQGLNGYGTRGREMPWGSHNYDLVALEEAALKALPPHAMRNEGKVHLVFLHEACCFAVCGLHDVNPDSGVGAHELSQWLCQAQGNDA